MLRYKIKTMDEGIKDVIINVQTNHDEALANLVAYKKRLQPSAQRRKNTRKCSTPE